MKNYIYFDTPTEKGIAGNVFFSNGYGAIVTRIDTNTGLYNIAFLIQQDYHTWSCYLDDKLLNITQERELYNLDETQIDNYLSQIKVL
jgi:hypothetical protein